MKNVKKSSLHQYGCTENSLFSCEYNKMNKIYVSILQFGSLSIKNINRNYINNANSKLMIPDNLVRSSLSKLAM